MTDTLVEKVVEAWKDVPEWANLTMAQIAINVVLNEAVMVVERDPARPPLFDDIADNIRALGDKP